MGPITFAFVFLLYVGVCRCLCLCVTFTRMCQENNDGADVFIAGCVLKGVCALVCVCVRACFKGLADWVPDLDLLGRQFWSRGENYLIKTTSSGRAGGEKQPNL